MEDGAQAGQAAHGDDTLAGWGCGQAAEHQGWLEGSREPGRGTVRDDEAASLIPQQVMWGR